MSRALINRSKARRTSVSEWLSRIAGSMMSWTRRRWSVSTELRRPRLHPPILESLELRRIFSFTPPTVGSLDLFDDTGIPGDYITSVPVVEGIVQTSNGASPRSLPVQFDLNGDGAPEGMTYADNDETGNFTANLSGLVFTAGMVSARFRAGAINPEAGSEFVFGNWSNAINFTYEPEEPTGLDDPSTHLPDIGSAVFLSSDFQPDVEGVDGYAPTDYYGQERPGTEFAAYTNRIYPTQGSSYVINDVDNNASPIVDSWSDGQGNYVRTTQDTHARHVISVQNANGTWTYSETYLSWRSVATTFTGFAGTSWTNTQVDTHSYIFDATGTYSSNGQYDFSEDRVQTLSFDLTVGGVTAYSEDASQNYAIVGSGTNVNYSRDESLTYHGDGASTFTSQFAGSSGNEDWTSAVASSTSWDADIVSIAEISPGGYETQTLTYWISRADDILETNDREWDDTRTEGGGGRTVVTTESSDDSLTSHTTRNILLSGSGVRTYGYYFTGSTTVAATINVDDELHHTGHLTVTLTDSATPGISVSGNSSANSTAHRVRAYEANNVGTTSFDANTMIGFGATANGRNETTSNWSLNTNANSSGSDQSVQGVNRNYDSARTRSEQGTSHYLQTSSGSKAIDMYGQVSHTGTTDSVQDDSGQYNWSNNESSSVDSNTITETWGLRTERREIGTSNSIDQGSGNYTAHAQGHTHSTAGSISRTGSTSHNGQTNGSLSTNHNYQTTQNVRDTSVYNRESVTDSVATFTSQIVGQFTATAIGSGSYSNGSSTVNDRIDRQETGSATSESTEYTTVQISDQSNYYVTVESSAATEMSSQSQSDYTLNGRSINTHSGGATTWSDSSDRVEQGTISTSTSSNGSESREDRSVYNVTSDSQGSSSSTTQEDGSYTLTETLNAQGSGAGTSSTIDRARDEEGSYTIQTDSATQSTIDDQSGQLHRQQSSQATNSFNGGGSYTKSRSSNEQSGSGGQYTAEFRESTTTDDSGKSAATLDSEVSVSGTTSNGSTVTDTDFTSTYSESRSGNQSRTSESTSDSITQYGSVYTSTSDSATSDESGSTNWSGSTQSSETRTTNNGNGVVQTETAVSNSTTSGSGSFTATSDSQASTDGNGGWERSSTARETSSGTNSYTNTSNNSSDLNDTHEPGVTVRSQTSVQSTERGGGTYSVAEDRDSSSSSNGQNHNLVSKTSRTRTNGTTDSTLSINASNVRNTSEYAGTHGYINSGGGYSYAEITKTTNSNSTNTLTRRSQGSFSAQSDLASLTDDGQSTSSRNDLRSDSGNFTETSREDGTASIKENAGGVYSKNSNQTMRANANGSGTFSARSLDYSETFTDGTSASSNETSYSSRGSSSLAMNSTASSDISITYDQQNPHSYKSSGKKTETRSTSSTVNDTSEQDSHTYRDGTQDSRTLRETTENGSISTGHQYNADSSEARTTRTDYGSYVETVKRNESSSVVSSGSGTIMYSTSLVDLSESYRDWTQYTYYDSASQSDSTFKDNDKTSFNTTVQTSGNPDHTQNQTSKSDLTYSLSGSAYVEKYVSGENGQLTTVNSSGANYREITKENSKSTNAATDITRHTGGSTGLTTKNSDSSTTISFSANVNHTDSLDTTQGPGVYESNRRLDESETFSGSDVATQNVTVSENLTYPDGTTRSLSYTGSNRETKNDAFNATQSETETSNSQGHSRIDTESVSGNSTESWNSSNSSNATGTNGASQTFTRNTQTDTGNTSSQYSYNFTINNGSINGTRQRTANGSGNFVDSVTKGMTVTDNATLPNGTRTTQATSSHTDTTSGNYNANGTYSTTVTNGDRNETGNVTHNRSVTEEQRDDESFTVSESTSDSGDGWSNTAEREETRGRATISGTTTDTVTTISIQTGQPDDTDIDTTTTSYQQREFSNDTSHSYTSQWTGPGGTYGNSQSSNSNSTTINRGTEDTTHGNDHTHAVTRSESSSNSSSSSGDYSLDTGRSGSYSNSSDDSYTRNDRRSGDGSGDWSQSSTSDSQSQGSDSWYGNGDSSSSSSYTYAATVATSGIATYTQYSATSDYDSYWEPAGGGWWERSSGSDSTTMSGNSLQYTYNWSYSNPDYSDSGSESWSSPFDPTYAPGYILSGWEDTWNFFLDIASNLSYETFVLWNSAVQAWYNPLGFITGVWDGILEYVETQVDATIGVIDGFLNGINPFDAWWSIPDIGPVFGHTDAYFVGQIVGTIGSVVASIAIGNVAGGTSGLIACGSLIHKAAKVYTAVDTVAGIAIASKNIYDGNAGVGDALAFLPVATMGLQKLRGIETNCFEGGTQVMAVGKNGELVSRNIEDINVGDEVWSRDENNPDAPMVARKVTDLYRKTVFDLQALTVKASDGTSEVLHVTNEHTFYVAGKGWVEASKLAVGERLIGADGREMVVTANVDDPRPEGVVVYNINVAEGHTYAVADSTGESAFIWTHNACRLTPLEQLDQGKTAARQSLDRAIGGKVGDGLDAHHIIPLEAIGDFRNLLERAARGGFGINSAENGILLASRHGIAGHPRYNAYVFRKLAAIRNDLSDADTASAVRDIASILRGGLSRYGRPLP